MNAEKVKEACMKAFGFKYQDVTANRELAMTVHNAIATGSLIERAMPKRYEKWEDEKGVPLVAVPVEQMEGLLAMRDEHGAMLTAMGRNMHGLPRLPSEVRYGHTDETGETLVAISQSELALLENRKAEEEDV